MSQRALSGHHLVLRFRDKDGCQEIHGLAFALHGAQLKVTDEFGDWQPLLRFDYDDGHWHCRGGRSTVTLVSELRLEHSDGEELTVAFYNDLAGTAGQTKREQDFRGSILFELPTSERAVLIVKLHEESASSGGSKRPKPRLAYQEQGSFRWRAIADSRLGEVRNAVGTLVIRTPGRGLVPEVRIAPGRASRPTGLAEGLNRVA